MSGDGPGADLRSAVQSAITHLRGIDDARSATPVAPGKWSPRQIMGHLIDSATNNHRRFVLAQLKDDLRFDGYAQDSWVDLQRYQETSWSDILDLWEAFNLQLARVMDAVPDARRLRETTDHNLESVSWEDVEPGAPVSLDFMMRDYTGHLRNHLRQIGPELSAPPRFQLS